MNNEAALGFLHPAQRNPASLLYDLCLTEDLPPPDYKLFSVEGAVHDPTFTYKLEIVGLEFRACGSSKQKAKHAVAKVALEGLLSPTGKFPNGFTSDGTTYTREMLNEFSTVAVPSDKSGPNVSISVADNPVGDLQEACIKEKWIAPHYENISESGLPHEREFECSCIVRTNAGKQFEERATDKSKKAAKRLAAYKMVNTLKEKGLILVSEKKPKTNNSDLDISNNENGSNIEELEDALEKLKVNIIHSNTNVNFE